MKKILALLLALAMILMVGAAFAENGTITITPPTGVDPNGENSYPIYKVFDAIYSTNGISYSVMSTKSGVPNVAAQIGTSYDAASHPHFVVDEAGNVHYGTEANGTITDVTGELSEAAIKAIAAYVAGDTPVATATSVGTADATASIPQDGYYYIATSTGTAVTITSFRPNAEVNDKNSVPGIDKKITGTPDTGSFDTDGKKALQEVGKVVEYTVEITIENGAKSYEFHDSMSAGLAYNDDLVITVNDTPVVSGDTTWSDADLAEGETIHIAFEDAYVAANVGETIVITYSATVTSDALQTIPAKNTAKITYGNNSGYSSETKETKVYNAKISVIKTDGEQPLAGAGFVLKKGNAYYKFNAASGTTPASITWYTLVSGETLEDAIAAGHITEYVSAETTGIVPSFTGLADGTYTLVESTVPQGYNKAADKEFEIDAHDYTADNLSQDATVINKSGTELPTTGGIGTTIFYIVGGLLVLGAAIILITRRKAESK